MNILITGDSGFIGSNLTKSLIQNPNLTLYGVGRHHILSKSKNFIPIEADFSTSAWTKQLPKGIDMVVHLAQSKNYRNFPNEAQDIFSINVKATFELLEWARKNGIKQFILASTGNVYKQKKGKLTEGDSCEPEGFYAASKYAAEILCKQYASFFNITILRLFGVYGPGQKNALIPTIIENIRTNRNIEVVSGVGLYLAPLFINDCLNMLQTIINTHSKEKKVEIYNLSGDEFLSLKQMASIIGEKLGKSVKFLLTKNSPRYFLGSNDLFKSQFAYVTPLTSFRSGIAKYL